MHFGDTFWNQTIGDCSGWESIVNILKHGRHNLKTYAESLRQRAEVEESYGKCLLKLSKSFPFDTDLNQLNTAWEHYRAQTEATAEAHLKTAKDLTQEASYVLEFTSKLRDTRKEQEIRVREQVFKLKQDHRKLIESKRNYEARCNDEIICSQSYHEGISKYGKHSKEVEKAKIKFDRMKTILDTTKEIHKTQIEETELCRKNWESDTSESFKIFQTLEEDRLKVARQSLWRFANISSIHCIKEDNSGETLRLCLDKFSISECLQEIIKQNSTGESKPEAFFYESLPNSSHYGLSPATTTPIQERPYVADIPKKTNFISYKEVVPIIPPKPPRLIHYAPYSWQNSTTNHHPFVDSVDNLEYFNLCETSLSNSSSDNQSSTSDNNRYLYSQERKEKLIN